MKKTMCWGALLLIAGAATGFAQESRQDVSISGTGLFAPEIHGPNAVQLNTTSTLGALVSYRYMVTPRSALEANYSFAQLSEKFVTSNLINARVHTRIQEVSAAYVYSRNYRNFSPFLEAGPGALLFSPLKDSGTTLFSLKRNTNIGGLFGGGVAYELSPSFDVRAEYRGFVVKTPDFGYGNGDLKTGRYEVISTPSIGIAYHF